VEHFVVALVIVAGRSVVERLDCFVVDPHVVNRFLSTTFSQK
jgi:hypothetical protein